MAYGFSQYISNCCDKLTLLTLSWEGEIERAVCIHSRACRFSTYDTGLTVSLHAMSKIAPIQPPNLHLCMPALTVQGVCYIGRLEHQQQRGSAHRAGKVATHWVAHQVQTV